MKISIVTTLYKTSEFIGEFCTRITAEVKKITTEYEIIMVDDGSPDNSLEIALNALQKDENISVIELSRNFGHHKAMMTGMEHADGDLIFLIDGDLEEPPELLSIFYKEMCDGCWDVIYGYQEERKGKWFEKNAGRMAWWLIDVMLPIHIPKNQSTVRLMTKEYKNALALHKEHKSAIGGLMAITGFNQKGIPFKKGLRSTTSYSKTSRLLMLLDSVTSFSEWPLFFILFLGIGIFLLSCVWGVYLIMQKLYGHVLSGWASTMVSIWLLGGLGIFSIGVIGLYVSRIFIETKNRPYVIIRKMYDKHDRHL